MLFSALFRKNIRSFDDKTLVDLIRKGDKKAMGEIFRRYSPLVMGLSLKYLKQTAKAEDMMMDIFEKLPVKIQKGDISNFKSWLFTVSRNECLMFLRKQKVPSTDFETSLQYSEDKSEETLALAQLKEAQLSELEKAITLLKDEQRKAIELFYLKNQSYDQVSEQMNVPVKKVKSLIQNGKRNLKLKMA